MTEQEEELRKDLVYRQTMYCNEVSLSPGSINRVFKSSIIEAELYARDKFISETLKTKAFPRLIGKANRYSLYWRFIKLEVHQTSDPLCNIYKLRQFGKIINQLKYKISIRM